MSSEYYGNQKSDVAALGGQLKAFTVRDRIEQQLKEIEIRKAQLLEFRDLLDKNPDTERILNLSHNL